MNASHGLSGSPEFRQQIDVRINKYMQENRILKRVVLARCNLSEYELDDILKGAYQKLSERQITELAAGLALDRETVWDWAEISRRRQEEIDSWTSVRRHRI